MVNVRRTRSLDRRGNAAAFRLGLGGRWGSRSGSSRRGSCRGGLRDVDGEASGGTDALESRDDLSLVRSGRACLQDARSNLTDIQFM